jgi:hypothetical protein
VRAIDTDSLQAHEPTNVDTLQAPKEDERPSTSQTNGAMTVVAKLPRDDSHCCDPVAVSIGTLRIGARTK